MAEYLYGLLNLSFWGYVAATFAMVQLSMMAVTLYLHREQAHHVIALHPALRHFFRLWVWLSSGMQTRAWVAIHRKHHVFSDRKGDPHSPVVFGLRKVLFEGAELYRAEAKVAETLEKYGRGTPDDWLERGVYRRLPYLGNYVMLGLDLLLFGVPGITVFAVQMLTMPVFAAGVINGLGHHSGYRNFETDDASSNLLPIAILIGGEELHNNHHAFPESAKFSCRGWEFDIGWLYVRVLRLLGLCRVRSVMPRPQIAKQPRQVDGDTVRAVLLNRMHVLRDYTQKVTLPVLRVERKEHRGDALLRKARKLLVCPPLLLDEAARAGLARLLARDQALRTVYDFRRRLASLWEQVNGGNEAEQLVAQLRKWCADAEASGIAALREYAVRLRGYMLRPA